MSNKKIEKLIGRLRDINSHERRSSAAKVLGEIGNASAVKPLINALGDWRQDVREKAAEALGKIRDMRAIEPLVYTLGDKENYVRRRAAWALGEIGSARAVVALIKALEDGDSDVRKISVEALGKIGDPQIVEILIQVLENDQHSDVRRSAAEVLDKLNWSPASNTEIVYYYMAKCDWGKVVSLGTSAVEPLIRALKNGNSDVQESTVVALVKIGKPAVEPLIGVLVDEDSYVRTSAVDALVKLLGDKDSNIKNKTTELLEKFCPQITEIIFGEILSNNTGTYVKNLETLQLTIPMSSLAKVHIDADTYDFDMVERFITYAINYVCQKHLKKKVEVYIYGNPDKLHPNLLNSFKNLCRKVVVCKK